MTQFAKLDRIIDSRRAQAAAYAALFAGSGIVASREAPGSRHVFQSFVVLLPADAAARRAEIIANLKRADIETTIGTYHMPMTTYFRQRARHVEGQFPVTDDVARRALSLPVFEGLTVLEQDVVAGNVRKQIEALATAA